jgi:hypothetical protein
MGNMTALTASWLRTGLQSSGAMVTDKPASSGE